MKSKELSYHLIAIFFCYKIVAFVIVLRTLHQDSFLLLLKGFVVSPAVLKHPF